MMKCVMVILLSCCWLTGTGQFYNQRTEFLNANKVWTFGEGAGYDFNTRSAIRTAMNAGEGCVSVCGHRTGNLLFYSNGRTCHNAGNSLMLSSGNLLGNARNTTTQGVCVVPFLSGVGKYYLFSMTEEGLHRPALYYSVVDTSLSGGSGDIVRNQKNIVLDSSRLSESMIAVPGDHCDVWLLVHLFELAEFRAYRITTDGIDMVPVISVCGTQIQGKSAYTSGSMAVSPDRKLLAIVSEGNAAGSSASSSGILLCRFDPSTGMVSDALKISDSAGYGVCFSPGNSKLYASMTTNFQSSGVDQYEVGIHDSATIVASRTRIASGMQLAYALKLYNDTIYCGTPSAPWLSRINNPEVQGISCDFQQNAVALAAGTSMAFGLPGDVVYPLPQDTTYSRTNTFYCAGQDAPELHAPDNFLDYEWNGNGSGEAWFAVPGPGMYYVHCRNLCGIRVDSFYVEMRNPEMDFTLGADTVFCSKGTYTLNAFVADAQYRWSDHSTGGQLLVNEDGQYWVTVTKDGCTRSDSVTIAFRQLNQSLGADMFFCNGDPIDLLLNASLLPDATILWSTGSTDSLVHVYDTGSYWVVVDAPPCSATDTIRVSTLLCDCAYYMPTAFTPNQDGKNDLFRPVFESGCPVNRFSLSVYNRWGQQMFRTHDPLGSWDGKYNGLPAELGTYMYAVSFEAGTEKKQYQQTGDVILMR